MIGQLSHSLPIRDLLPAQSSVRKQFIVYLEWQVRVRTALSLTYLGTSKVGEDDPIRIQAEELEHGR